MLLRKSEDRVREWVRRRDLKERFLVAFNFLNRIQPLPSITPAIADAARVSSSTRPTSDYTVLGNVLAGLFHAERIE